MIWNIKYSKIRNGFVHEPGKLLLTNGRARKVFVGGTETAERSQSRILGRFAFAGDQGRTGSDRLLALMTAGYREKPESFDEGSLDLEPLRCCAKCSEIPLRPVRLGEHHNC